MIEKREWKINEETTITYWVEAHEGWEKIEETTPSGKVQFRCKTCDRISIAPNKTCTVDGPIEINKGEER